jgi:hypothetical protein
MNHPNVSVLESRSGRAGSLRVIRSTAILAAVVLTASLATADVNPINNIHPTGGAPGTGNADSPEVAAARKKVGDLKARLHGLYIQLGTLKTHEPAQTEVKAHGSWQQQVDKLQHQIDVLEKQLAVAEKELEAAKAKAAHAGH